MGKLVEPNCLIYGAGDGNRTHVRSLGSFYTAIVRRPLFPDTPDYSQEQPRSYRCALALAICGKLSVFRGSLRIGIRSQSISGWRFFPFAIQF